MILDFAFVPLRSRDYADHSDLGLVRRLISECWRLEGPYVQLHVGDATWMMFQHLDKLDEVRIRLWLDRAGEPRAWGWLWLPGTLVALIHPRERPALLEEVLDWFEGTGSHNSDDYMAVWAIEADGATVDEARRRGYAPHEPTAMNHMLRVLDGPLPVTALPPDYTARTVSDADAQRRVDVHRAAFAPSRVVAESYRRLMREPPYNPDLDYVIEAGDGTFAAFCLVWLDEENRVAELEPVGTHPDHRRRGLASAVCLTALEAARQRGAQRAVVYSVVRSPAQSLYESLGFRTISRHVELRRERGNNLRRQALTIH